MEERSKYSRVEESFSPRVGREGCNHVAEGEELEPKLLQTLEVDLDVDQLTGGSVNVHTTKLQFVACTLLLVTQKAEEQFRVVLLQVIWHL